jgi:hypothetical protein
MERLKDAGLVRSIGVSNFDDGQLAELIKHAKYPPAANQVRILTFLLCVGLKVRVWVTCKLQDETPTLYLYLLP